MDGHAKSGPEATSVAGAAGLGVVAAPQTTGILQGPSAAREVLQAFMASGMEPPAFVLHWRTTSRVNIQSGLEIEHGLWVEMLWVHTCHDLVNPLRLACAELPARRILMIERAVRRNARAPSFDGLQSYMAHTLDPHGGARASQFANHIADIQ